MFYKNQSKKNKWYWSCEFYLEFGCSSRVITEFLDGKHFLCSHSEHNHNVEAIRVNVAKTLANIRRQAVNTHDAPAQIIQDARASVSLHTNVSLPSTQNVRQLIKRARKKVAHVEPITAHHL